MNAMAPSIIAATFNYARLPHFCSFTFSRDVSGTLSTAALQVRNVTADSPVPAAVLDYEFETNTAIFRFAGQVASGSYRATLLASRVTDLAGRHPAADFHLEFFFLAGDVNHDGKVDSRDLEIIARNYHRTNASYADGDLNYDGRVDLLDLTIVLKNYLQTLPGAGSPVTSMPPRIPFPTLKRRWRHRRRRS